MTTSYETMASFFWPHPPISFTSWIVLTKKISPIFLPSEFNGNLFLGSWLPDYHEIFYTEQLLKISQQTSNLFLRQNVETKKSSNTTLKLEISKVHKLCTIFQQNKNHLNRKYYKTWIESILAQYNIFINAKKIRETRFFLCFYRV